MREITLKSVAKAKAGELQTLVLHVFLPVFRDHMSLFYFCHFGLLITAIQILNQTIVTEADINLAEEMINKYQSVNRDLYGDQAETYTTHALGHLPRQRKLHECSVVLPSNFVFEGFIATLKRQFHGSRSIVNQMVKGIAMV